MLSLKAKYCGKICAGCGLDAPIINAKEIPPDAIVQVSAFVQRFPRADGGMQM